MILNVFTVAALFLAAIGLALAIGSLAVATRSLVALRRNPDRSGVDAFEDRAHLLSLLVGVLLGVRFLAWPHFYLVLDSYVPDLAVYGVMCSYGVTLIEAPVVSAVQWLKPVGLFGLALWMVFGVVDRRAGSPVLLPVRIALTMPVATVVAAECVVEALYLVREKVGRPVTCCTRFRDTEAASVAENLSPLARLGETAPSLSIGLLFGAGIAVIALAALLARRRSTTGVLAATVVGLLGVANLIVTQWSWIDAVAPRVLRLPYHHCVYELITDTPGLGPAALLAIVGSAGLLIPAALAPWRHRAPEPIAWVQRKVYAFCAVAIASELLIVGVHVV